MRSYWRYILTAVLLVGGVAGNVSAVVPPSAGEIPPVIHDPWLNWDFIVPGTVPVNDVHVVVANSDWVPGETADDPGLPTWQ